MSVSIRSKINEKTLTNISSKKSYLIVALATNGRYLCTMTSTRKYNKIKTSAQHTAARAELVTQLRDQLRSYSISLKEVQAETARMGINHGKGYSYQLVYYTLSSQQRANRNVILAASTLLERAKQQQREVIHVLAEEPEMILHNQQHN